MKIDEIVDCSIVDEQFLERILEYKSHYQQWIIQQFNSRKREMSTVERQPVSNSERTNQQVDHHITAIQESIIDALIYYDNKIGDNRFQTLLRKYTNSPKNILTLTLDDIKSTQHDFEDKYNRLTKKQIEKLRRNILIDTDELKIIEFKNDGINDDETANALSLAAKNTRWCVVNTDTGKDYLVQGALYLITMKKFNGTTDRYLCHIESTQLMDINDHPIVFPEDVCKNIEKYINLFGIFCSHDCQTYRDAAKKIPKLALNVSKDIIGGRWPEAEPYIMQDTEHAYLYAKDILKCRWLSAEKTIMNNQCTAYLYAWHVIKGRWPEAEPIILRGEWARYYARNVIKDRWPQLESYIIDTGNIVDAYSYALYTIQDRWFEAEPIISKDIYYSYLYAQHIAKCRLPLAEQNVLTCHLNTLDRTGRHESPAARNDRETPDPVSYLDPTPNQLSQEFHPSPTSQSTAINLSRNLPDYDAIYGYAKDIIKGRWPEAEPIIIQHAGSAYGYARDIVNGRWPEAEPTIMKDPQHAYLYAYKIVKGRWLEAEPHIMKHLHYSVAYTHNIIMDRWLEAEPAIMQNAEHAYYYARDIIKGRWLEAELTIMKESQYACDYAINVINGKWPEAEPYIILGLTEIVSYASKALKERWLEAEEYIIRNSYYACEYAILVIKGRWPEAEECIKSNHNHWHKYNTYFNLQQL